ncbi:pseudouridine synthase family protein [Synechococcus sp. PCC 7502]|uniref:pseudouridine synthase n=1 Tax=Synechococcus sp. PCC 7502 TaxID=1173263 RepID=UPI00029F9327|nr:pseudouridine synthase [Synechococcus sp. PCC 7502]AFY74557.1 pseudouridine synthase family protein [Synechococcus sp. PCC 7502]
MAERLQKILASYGIASRRKSEDLIASGRVRINNQLITTLGTKADPNSDRITVDGKLINIKPQLEYLLLHKLKGYICSRHDPQGRRTIQELLPPNYQHLYSVGRLDYDSSGALLLTNDGDFANRLTHPRHHVPKVYEVIVQGHPSDRILDQWRQGIELDGKLTLPAQVQVLASQAHSTKLQITLKEGRNRQIRRVAEILGNPVLELHRVAIATVNLNNLAPGAYRLLDQQELAALGL